MIGALTGVILLSLVTNILTLSNVSSTWIDAVDGAIILIALGLAKLIGTERA
jgi:simple sugar transport system permease protein